MISCSHDSRPRPLRQHFRTWTAVKYQHIAIQRTRQAHELHQERLRQSLLATTVIADPRGFPQHTGGITRGCGGAQGDAWKTYRPGRSARLRRLSNTIQNRRFEPFQAAVKEKGLCFRRGLLFRWRTRKDYRPRRSARLRRLSNTIQSRRFEPFQAAVKEKGPCFRRGLF